MSPLRAVAWSLALSVACGGTPEKPAHNDGSAPAVDSGGKPATDSGPPPGNDAGGMPAADGDDAPVADAGRADTAAPVDRPVVAADSGPAGTWPLKFCHALTDTDGKSIDVTIEIGQPPVRLTTSTGTCAPALGVMCPLVASGSAPYTLYQGTKVLDIGSYGASAGATQVLAFIPNEDTPVKGDIQVVMGIFNPATKCETLDPTNVLPRP
jgi:hypothetical protein